MSQPTARRGPGFRLTLAAAGLAAVATLCGPQPAPGAWVWVEGEKPLKARVQRFAQWYDNVKRDQFSGRDFISNWDEKNTGELSYEVKAPADGAYDLWVRANPILSRLSYKVDSGEWAAVDQEKKQQDVTNVAADGKPDLRFLAWTNAGRVKLTKGPHAVRFRMDSANHNHGYLDCFLLTTEAFTPRGPSRPDQLADADRKAAAQNVGWFAFAPGADPYSPTSGINLRPLNEPVAGQGGVIGVKGGRFVHTGTGEPVRFWAVNGPASKDPEGLRRDARTLAKRGVNLVRLHHPYFDGVTGDVKPDEVLFAHDVVDALKAEGIYTHFSVYFPLWLNPKPGNPFLKGYDGNAHPFAALYFNPDFQARYRTWLKALLTTPHPKTGRRLADEPAVAGVEMVNEDSFFFWTFNGTIPDPQFRMLEAQFGDWLKARYGSIDAAIKRWGGLTTERDRPAEGRVSFRPLYNMAAEKTARDKDTARFLAETQRGFYKKTYDYIRSLGFKGLVTASNWVTANAEVLGPLEKYTYAPGDFFDRHGYFGGPADGPDAAWAIKEGLTYADRSALRFDPPAPGAAAQFGHPAVDVHYDGKPSMISETTWNRPNRYRSEAPLFYAAFGALQGSDAVVHFAFDGASWSVKPGFFMQPWTLMAPSQMGQFPAAALIFRKGLVSEGDVLADLNLTPEDLFDLKGTPLPQDAAFDELRLKDVPKGLTLKPGDVIDPLIHFAGRTSVSFSERPRPPALKDLSPYVDRAAKTVKSTNGHLRLDYGKGLLTINAPSAQGLSGTLREAGTADLTDLTISSPMDLGHVVAVSLDDRPLSSSRKILLQVMSEEKAADFRTEPAPKDLKKVVSIGHDPWLVRDFTGTVSFKRPDAAALKVTALDANGEPLKTVVGAGSIRLGRTILYYLIEPSSP